MGIIEKRFFMKASELRIGNMVTDEFYNSFKKTIVVDSINDKGINLSIENSDDFPEMQSHWISPYYEFDKLRGIQLTEEWFLKFGFIGNLGNGFSKKEIHVAHITTDEVFEFEFQTPWSKWHLIKVQYVHQLQNLYFALTGNELTLI